MSQRSVRVNELVKREISDILHTRYQKEAVMVTVSDVNVAPNLRKATVYYSVLGGEENSREAARLLAKENQEIRRMLSKRVVLKYLPHLTFEEDESLARGSHLNQIIDELDIPGEEADDSDRDRP